MVKYSIRCNLYTKAHSDGSRAIRMRVSWAGKRVTVSLVNAIMPENWDAGSGMPKRTQRLALREIDEQKANVSRLFELCHVEGRVPCENDVLEALGCAREDGKNVDGLLLIDVMERLERDSTIGGAWSDNTRRNYGVLKSRILGWNARQELATFDRRRMESFMDYCYGCGMKNSSVMKFMKQLRWVIRTAADNGLCKITDAVSFRPKFRNESENDVVYLTRDELQRVMELDLTAHAYLGRVRDVFLFCCFSGLRYSDVAKLRRGDIHGDYIKVVTKKTSDSLTIELNDVTKAIISKYADNGDSVLPVISNQKMNNYLKEIGRLAHVDEPVKKVWWVRNQRYESTQPKWEALTTHCGRKTFVVTALSLNIASEVIMKWTGHKDHQSMKPYIAIANELKKEQMSKFDALASELKK